MVTAECSRSEKDSFQQKIFLFRQKMTFLGQYLAKNANKRSQGGGNSLYHFTANILRLGFVGISLQ